MDFLQSEPKDHRRIKAGGLQEQAGIRVRGLVGGHAKGSIAPPRRPKSSAGSGPGGDLRPTAGTPHSSTFL